MKIKNKIGPSYLDLPLLFSVGLLVIFGLVMVYDASVVHAFRDFGDKYYYIKQQLVWVVLGFGLMFAFSIFDYHRLKALAVPGMLLSFLLLLAVFIPSLGVSAGGAHRWLRLGFLSVQPTEIIKLASVLFFASIFEKVSNLKLFLFVLLAASVIIGIFQRDMGSAIVFIILACSMYIVSGAPLKYLLALSPLSLIALIYFIWVSSYRKNRILAFLDPFADPQGYTYHISQILIALGSGGLFGIGLGQSRQKFEYIPEVTTDSIFAVIGEELGFLGALALIGVFLFLVYRGIAISEKAPDSFGRLLSFGVVVWIGSQALINLAAMTSLIPLTGVPLPFISYGGSALLTNLVGIGILLNVSKFTKMRKL